MNGQWQERAGKQQSGAFALNVSAIKRLRSNYAQIQVARYINTGSQDKF